MSRKKRLTYAVAALVAGISFANCGDDLGPDGAGLGHLAIQPVFSSGAAAVDVTAIRARLSRPGQEGFAADTTIPLTSDSGTVEIPLTVQLRETTEEFLLEILIVGAQGDTVFKGGPTLITVRSGSDEPTVTEVPIEYVGVGANALAIFIEAQTLEVPTGGELLLTAVVLDSSENVIEGTPILWSSLDQLRATVPDRETGRIVAGETPGPVGIVAKTLTGLADTVTVNVVPPRPPQIVRWINAQGGSWTTGANWDLGTSPAPLDTAIIDAPGTYTVTLNTAVSVGAFTLGTASRSNTQELVLLGALDVTGDIALNPAGKLTLGDGSGVNGGDQLLLGGIIVGATASTTVSADVQGAGGGVIDISTGTLSVLGDLLLVTSDVVRGSGVLNLTNAGTVQLGGTIAPGTSPGILQIDHDPTFLSATQLNIELDGTNVAEYDRLDINGAVILDGTLNVFIGEFFPTPGDVFTVMTYGDATGQFATINGTDLGNGAQLILEYDETELRLVVVGPEPVFTAQPRDVLPGQDINPVIEVEFRDPITGDPLPNFTEQVTLSLEANPTGANLVGEFQTFTDGATAFFGFMGVDRVGTGYTLRVTAPTAMSTVSAPFNVIEGIVFSGFNGTFQGVSSLHPNGSNLTTIASLQAAIDIRSFPRWSPNRLRVVHTFTASSGVREVHIASSNGDTVATVMSDTSGLRPAWNMTGDHIAFNCGDGFSVAQDICTVQNIGSVPLTSLNNAGNGAGKTYVTDASPLVGLNGPGLFAWDPIVPNRLVVVRTVQGPSRPVSQLFAVNADGSNAVAVGPPLTTVAGDTLNIEELTWAPDGSFLVVAAENELTNRARIYRVDRNGSNLQLLTGNPTGFYDENKPVVSPDGSSVIYIQNTFDFEGSDWNYFVVSATGGTPQQMSNEAAFFVSSDELGADFSPDGSQIVFVGVDTSQPSPQPVIYIAPVTMRQATYFTDRVMISPTARMDVQPSWRP